MSNKIRVPFPRYLNAKKLLNRWEYDIVVASMSMGLFTFLTLSWITTHIVASLLISIGVVKYTLHKYIKHFKKTRKGFYWHLLYSKGYFEPINREKIKHDFESTLIPYGFETEFKN